MAVSQHVRAQRLTLAPGVTTTVTPPVVAQSVSIGNGTANDLYVYTNDDLLEYVVIPTGYERLIALTDAVTRFTPTLTAFWLSSAPGGTVVLLWH